MNDSIKTGLCFGLTSGIITTLGLMVGLHSGTNSKLVVMGGILTIAVADAFSDALGIHVSEESKKDITEKEVWGATLSTFFSKFIFALTFIVPVLFLELHKAVFVSVLWGLLVLGILSFFIARKQGTSPFYVVFEHIFIAVLVICITHYTGAWIAQNFV